MSIPAVCMRVNCGKEATHLPCCSSHGHPLCCGCYRYTHFVEVGPCCGQPSPEQVATYERLEGVLRDLEGGGPGCRGCRCRLRAHGARPYRREILSPPARRWASAGSFPRSELIPARVLPSRGEP